MSRRQWGHGFYSGEAKGKEYGEQLGIAKTEADIAESSYQCLCAAIDALESGNQVRGLSVLRVLRDNLGRLMGHDIP